jgi:flagellar basal-body rod protein FlgB
MQIGGLAVLSALTDKMRWHQARQGVLAENVANADTPNYIERDLKAFSFGDEMKSIANISVSTTSPSHISVASSATGAFGSQSAPFEITPSGNGVTLEDEMMKVTGNEMDYQTVTALYMRSVRLLKVALGRQA